MPYKTVIKRDPCGNTWKEREWVEDKPEKEEKPIDVTKEFEKSRKKKEAEVEADK